jgi:hypothetical protein
VTCCSKCEIIEWRASNPYLVKEAASSNVSMVF